MTQATSGKAGSGSAGKPPAPEPKRVATTTEVKTSTWTATRVARLVGILSVVNVIGALLLSLFLIGKR